MCSLRCKVKLGIKEITSAWTKKAFKIPCQGQCNLETESSVEAKQISGDTCYIVSGRNI